MIGLDRDFSPSWFLKPAVPVRAIRTFQTCRVQACACLTPSSLLSFPLFVLPPTHILGSVLSPPTWHQLVAFLCCYSFFPTGFLDNREVLMHPRYDTTFVTLQHMYYCRDSCSKYMPADPLGWPVPCCHLTEPCNSLFILGLFITSLGPLLISED
jgi:hypothetical protein